MKAEISYGKAQVSVYRTYAAPLRGIVPVPESPFIGRDNTLFAAEVDVEVFGDNFMRAYTEGDNSTVVPTDTMKNFILHEALDFEGATLEGFLYFLGGRFLLTYPQMHRLRLTGREQPFDPVPVPGDGDASFSRSDVLFSRSPGSHAVATLELERGEGLYRVRILDHRCGLVDMRLIKVTGSAFASFPRDEHTTLPERTDRPLFIYLNAYWRYGDPARMVSPDVSSYAAPEQVRDFLGAVFHDFVSMSIQHLVHEMGTRLLDRFPQLDEVSFEAQNRLWDTAFTREDDERVKVYTDPRPPYGHIKLTLHRDQA